MRLLFLIILVFARSAGFTQHDSSYADKLGFPRGAKVIILHVDDAGMSFDSNQGAIKALTEGVASSVSIMMPCPWVPHFVGWLKKNPRTDAGLHLTLTSEWEQYKWGALSGAPAVPGLIDTATGAMHASVEAVVTKSNVKEVSQEVDAQIKRARQMGFEPTHLDSHMGTLFATPSFLLAYIQTGIRERIPVMFAGGHNTLVRKTNPMAVQQEQQIKQLAQTLWNAGLPVLDDLHNSSYGWDISADALKSTEALKIHARKNYIKALEECKPGLTMMIMHCTEPSEVFKHISDSGPTRQADMLAMTDDAVKAYIKEKGIIITTWREIMERRQKINSK
ncbi:polysaccharide deacetylase family protein [Flavihumibacter sp.]|uniref:polysaccharide deacetylase family protein n=1 Tax=Flavihumibacter sp. TaxID=1913981 RepID=UPI002FC6CB6E|nr:polysaccharide deacetylase family protein [Flavihumibacter sediminis]